MITIDLDHGGPLPLYQQLYRRLRERIEAGDLPAGEKLPSKRALADHLGISLKTVENALAQLQVEGYVDTIEKRGCYVRRIEPPPEAPARRRPPGTAAAEPPGNRPAYQYDLGTSASAVRHFPFSVWGRLMRETLRLDAERLLQPIHHQGDPSLRAAIASHLRQFRGMTVAPEAIVVGAGTEYLLGLLTELLPEGEFALENPTNPKWPRILLSRGRAFQSLAMDAEGASLADLARGGAAVALVTPARHFPLGTVMSINRRRGLLRWAAARPDRYLIEDDYDNEYRYSLQPVPTLQVLDRHDRVIYLNTFTRTLAPSLRIAYMILPRRLLDRFRRHLGFYACPVSAFEQGILRRFLTGGHYERHLNRNRTRYRARRDALIAGLAPLSAAFSVHGLEAGLHLLLTANDGRPEGELVDRAAAAGVRVTGLSTYYRPARTTSTVVAGFAGHEAEELTAAAGRLVAAWTTGRRQRRRPG
ncbi:MAG: PLP-dependent aminotransferase family protein [Planctomycetes bacterium]|nr:PLP-dependent aminotransferase family protein [Planctomycetota bacterium]